MEKRSGAFSSFFVSLLLANAAGAAALSPYSSDVSTALMSTPATNAWSVPHWGFLKPASQKTKQRVSVKSSLVFDQAFDAGAITTIPKRPLRLSSLLREAPEKKSAVVDVKHQASRARLVKPHGLASQVLVIDEDSLSFGEPSPLQGAVVHWVSPFSGLSRLTNAQGYAPAPYINSVSTRFVVTMPGYLPAVGYATAGHTTPVVLIKESRLGPVLKSLNIVPDRDRVLVLGKVLHENLAPAEGISVEATIKNPFKAYYSIGSFGLFHPAAKKTGAQGDFLLSGLDRGIQYIMPNEGDKEWPAWIIDTSGLSSVVTVTLTDSQPTETQTQVVDAWALEKPPVGIHVTLGGQRGLFIPDEEGALKVDQIYPRGSVDLLEVSAEGYLKTWLNTIARNELFPQALSLFTSSQVIDLLREVDEVDYAKGIVMGNLRAEQFKKPVRVQVFNALGRLNPDTQVLYFDSDNKLSVRQETTDPVVQNFTITNLSAGEWHVLVTDPASGKGLGIQTIRVEDGTITQVQF